jgi:alpha-galactosidase
LKALTTEEEKFHFGMWAINKSPLIIGCPTSPSITSQTSLDILANKEIIALNQDPLGKQARLARRFTEEEWDIWVGDLSGSRMVVGLSNWRNTAQTISFDLAKVLGVTSASARDVWAAQDVGSVSGTYTTSLAGHELKILVLSNIVKGSSAPQSAGYYTGTNAVLSGAATKVTCSAGQCLPSNTKVGNIGQGATAAAVSFSGVTAKSSGKKLLGIDYINYEIALDSAWSDGTNTRNMTVAVNGGTAKRWAFPISGGNWFETGRMMIEVDGFNAGSSNTVVFRPYGSGRWAPDLVGFEVFE